MLNKKFVFAVSLVAMMAVSNAWATDPASTSSTTDTVGTAHSVFTAYTPTEAGSKAGIAGVTYVNRAVNSAGNAAIAAENHAAASGAYAIDAKTAATQANTAAAAAQAAASAAQQTASEGVTKANAAQQTADKNTAAISGMDLTSVGADGSYIKTVAQADGKVTATAEAADTAPTQNSKKMVTSGGIYTALSNKLDKTGTAPKATADASGNVITSTYATKTELTSGLATKQNNLGYTAENSANKVTALSANSTDTQYPSAKLVYTELAKKQNNLTIDSAMSSTSTNPVQNKVVNTALGTKENVSNKLTGDTYTSGDTTKYPSVKTAEAIANTAVAATKSGLESLTERVAANEGDIETLQTGKQDKLTAGTNISIVDNTISSTYTYTLPTATDKTLGGVKVDTAISSTSTNPVQNKVVYTALSNKLDKTGTAPKATADASGNVITSTYATKTELTSGLATKQNNLGYTAENSANKVTALSADSTDTQYPSAKLVYTELAKKQNNLTIDSAMSSTSTNPVQNKVVNTALGTKENVSNKVTALSADSTDTQYPSAKLVYTELAKKQNNLTIDSAMSSTSTNPVQNKVVYTALSNKLDKTGTAPKATADASGNVITSTYATKSELTSGLSTKQNNLGYTAENSANKVTALSADSTDTQYPSAKLVYTELAKKQNNLTIDSAMSSTSTNPVQNKVVNAALSNKLDKTGTAPKATADASGNVITSTYATKSELTSGLATKQNNLGYTAENSANKVTGDTYTSGDTTKYPSVKTAEAIANTAVAATKSGLESLTERVAANEGVIDTLGTLAYKDTVTSALITDGAVATADIAGSAVTTAKIADSNVTTAKIASGAVTAGKTSGVIGKIPSGSATASTYADIWVE